MDFETETFVAHTLRSEGFDASEDGAGRGTPLVPVPFDTTQITSSLNRSNPKAGDPCHPLAAGAHAPAIAFHHNAQASQLPTAARDTSISDALTCSQEAAVAIDTYNQTEQATAHTIRSGAGMEGIPATYHAMQVRRLTPRECERLQGFPDDYTRIPNWNGWRKLDEGETPKSCAEQGLEVKQNRKTGAWRVKDVDGPRYKALGNSWAVNTARWVGARIAIVDQINQRMEQAA